jgi:hypothetical protein
MKNLLLAVILSTFSFNVLAGFPCTGANGTAGTSLTQGGFCYTPLAPDDGVCLSDLIIDDVDVCLGPVAGGSGVNITFNEVIDTTNYILVSFQEGKVKFDQRNIVSTFHSIANLFSSFVRYSRLDLIKFRALTEESNRILNSRAPLSVKMNQLENYLAEILKLRAIRR